MKRAERTDATGITMKSVRTGEAIAGRSIMEMPMMSRMTMNRATRTRTLSRRAMPLVGTIALIVVGIALGGSPLSAQTTGASAEGAVGPTVGPIADGTALSRQDIADHLASVPIDRRIDPTLMLPYPVDMILNPGGGGPRLSIGLLGGVTAMSHAGEFELLEDSTVCCQFDGGSGVGPVAGIRAEFMPDADGRLAFALRATWQEEGASFESDPEVLPIFGVNNEPEDATFVNALDIAVQTIDIAPIVMVKIIDADLFVSIGPSYSATLSSQTDLTEQITAPSDVTYVDGTTEKFRGDLPAALVADSRFSLLGGLDLRLPLAGDLSLSAEAYYKLGLTPFGVDDDWTASGIIGTLGLMYSFEL